MSLFRRLFGDQSIGPVDKDAAIAYLVQLNRLRAKQDDEASRYNDVLAKHGGGLAPGSDSLRAVADTARKMANLNAQIAQEHAALGPIPDLAGACYGAWSISWLSLKDWSSRAAAAYEGMYEGATPPYAAVNQLQQEEQRARTAATKEEAKLLKALRVTADEARRIVEEGERGAGN